MLHICIKFVATLIEATLPVALIPETLMSSNRMRTLSMPQSELGADGLGVLLHANIT